MSKVEYDTNSHRFTVSGVTAEMKDPVEVVAKENRDTVYIEKCTGGFVKISGKVNAVTVNNVSNVGVIVEDVISVVELINSKKAKLQLSGVVGTVVIDKCSSITVYANEHFRDNGRVLSTSSTAVNVNVPEGDDMKEYGLPEQLSHRFKGGKCVSEVASDLIG